MLGISPTARPSLGFVLSAPYTPCSFSRMKPRIRSLVPQSRPSHPSAPLHMSLTTLRDHTLRRLLPTQFTGDQWRYFWGITESDQFGRVYEAAAMTFFGLWTSWFLTFLIGVPLATILGTVFAFYALLAPAVAAYRRNQSFHRGSYFARHQGDSGIFGALFSGWVVRVGKVTQRREYNRPEAIVVSIQDEEGRKLRVYAPIQPSFYSIRPGMRCEGVILSESPDFVELIGVSDMFIPACQAWVGDYPYLDRRKFRAFLGNKIRQKKRSRQVLTQDALFGDQAESGSELPSLPLVDVDAEADVYMNGLIEELNRRRRRDAIPTEEEIR